MEGERRSMVTLPEELVGRILAMVPFPQIFKARVLSKSWQARFSPISSEDDEKERHLATWFQEQVGEWSSKWKAFYPCLVSHKNPNAYGRSSHSWQRMPLLSFLREHLFTGAWWHMEGSLLLVKTLVKRNAGYTEDFHMANILTRSWKCLPPRPDADDESPSQALLIYAKPMYKVIKFQSRYCSGAYHLIARIYDSNLDAWRSTKVSSSNDSTYVFSSWTHLDGVLYRVVGPSRKKATGLHAFSINEGTFEKLQMLWPVDRPGRRVELVVCNASLYMLDFKKIHIPLNYAADSAMVMKIDLKSRRWS